MARKYDTLHAVATATAMRRARSRSAPVNRLVHVLCEKPSGYRWLRANVRGATEQDDGRFLVHDESAWSESLAAAQGREVE